MKTQVQFIVEQNKTRTQDEMHLTRNYFVCFETHYLKLK